MFGRFFKNKEDGKGGPPGHRNSQPAGQSLEEQGGGGFFNLPPPVAKPASSQALSSANPAAAPAPGGNGVPGASYGGRPQTAPSYTSSGYGNPHEGGAAVGGGDMFGGMSVKNPPTAAPAASAGPGYQPAQYGGYGGGGSTAGASYSGPQPAATQPTSLFSGLDMAASGAAPTLGTEDPAAAAGGAPMANHYPERRKTPVRTNKSFNYLDVSANASAQASSTASFSRGSAGSAGSSASSRSSSKVVKKKKKSFRPGFGRQLSDESIAALQRGDLKEEDIIQNQVQRSDSRSSSIADKSESSRTASNPTDLAHLLPPVTAGSVLKGLTVHSGNGPSGGKGGVLAGLTVHATPVSPRGSKSRSSAAEPSRGSVLSGLQIHGSSSTNGDDDTVESSTPVPEEPVVVKEKHAPPPVPLALPTPEERLLNTLRDFNASAVNFRESIHKQNDEENRILERKVQLANQLTQYEVDLREVEAQQHHAVEVEDFEKADALNGAINSVKHMISLTESDSRKVEGELVAFVKAKEKSFANQLKSTRGTLRELEKFRTDQEMDRSSLQKELKKYESNQSEQLQFEAERIDTEMHHTTVDLKRIVAEKKEIETTIADQCSTEFELQAKLLKEQEEVEEEVRELERKLALKRERVQEIQVAIDEAQHDIDVVRGRYSRQLKRIADREEGILKTKTEVESDGQQLVHQREEFKNRIGQYEVDISTIGKRITAVRKEMRAAALLASVLEVQETRREQTIVRKRQHAAELSTLNDAVAVAEQSFTMLRGQYDEQDKSLSFHRNAIASAEAMIPRLEQEKKTAASQRNFKEAARISKDIKALEKDRSTAEEMVEVVEMELQDLQERISKRETEFEEKKEELKKMEKQLELNSLQELWKEAKHLRSSLRKLEKCKTEGVAADNGIDFRSSALLLVQAEYDACMVQVDALEKKYGVPDPAQDEEEEDEDEEEDSMDDEFHESGAITTTASTGGASDDVELDAAATGDTSMTLEDIESKLTELEGLIEEATENEQYERAAQLDDKIEALKRRRESVLNLAQVVGKEESHAPAKPAPEEEEPIANEEVDESEDDYPHEEYTHEEYNSPMIGAQTTADVETKLENLQLRIKMLEQQIELATENEDFDSAGAYDEELQTLLEEEIALHELLDEAPLAEASVPETSAASNEAPATTSLFGGLGVKEQSSASVHSSSAGESTSQPAEQGGVSGGSLFGGLDLNSSAKSSDSHSAASASAGPVTSLFGGLRVSDPPASAGSDPASRVESPESSHVQSTESPELTDAGNGAATIQDEITAAHPDAISLDSPTSSRMKDSFFGEQQPHPAEGSASSLMFSGLQLSGQALPEKKVVEHSSPVVEEEAEYVDASEEIAAAHDETPESAPEAAASSAPETAEDTAETEQKPAAGLFGGLQLSGVGSETASAPAAGDEPEDADELVDNTPKSAGDTPMTILELSDHSESTTHVAVRSTSLTSNDPSESAATETSSGLFGGLSLTGTTMASTTTTMATTTTTLVETRGEVVDEGELEEKRDA